MSSSSSKAQYYSLPLKRAMNMMTDAERSMRLFAETVKTFIEKYSVDDWGKSPIPDYMDAYLNSKVLRDFIQKKIQDPDENVAAYLKTNNVDGLIMSRDDLEMLYRLSTNFEETKYMVSQQC
jgi:hypothetical protein